MRGQVRFEQAGRSDRHEAGREGSLQRGPHVRDVLPLRPLRRSPVAALSAWRIRDNARKVYSRVKWESAGDGSDR